MSDESGGVALPPPRGRVDLLVVAGEHSGDEHAAELVRELRRARPNFGIAAVGGEQLQRAGAELLFDLTASSVVGLVEVLRHYRFFKRLFEAILTWIEEHRPRAVCLVDYPGFNLRLARALRERGLSRKGGGKVLVYTYISPQLWAWKSYRRFAMAESIDALAVIFPFEVAVYQDTTLPVRFVGHPFLREDDVSPVAYDSHGPLLLLPGSRRTPVSRIFPPMIRAARQLRAANPTLEVATVAASSALRQQIAELAARHAPSLPLGILARGEEASGRAVLTSSGTMSLRCALAGIPGAICYRAHPLTYWAGRYVARVPFLGIANLILRERPIYPEFIQGRATPERLAARVHAILTTPGEVSRAKETAARLREVLGQPTEGSAADWLLELIDG